MTKIKIRRGTDLQLDGVSLTFQRTLRIPDDSKRYPLPPGLGAFPVRRVDDYADTVPADWLPRGGVFLPMYQREAMWLNFRGSPHALKVGIGKVCAISGERWSKGLRKKPQNYVVTGRQPWLDGIASGKGTVKQFVAMPLGQGYTVEAQLTGEEKHGGIQLQCFPPLPNRIPPQPPSRRTPYPVCMAAPASVGGGPGRARAGSMGIAAGGKMKQKIYPDPHGIDVWDQDAGARVFVHIVNSELFRQITGEEPPASPVTAKSYANAGLPWYDLYDEASPTLNPHSDLVGIKSVSEIDKEKSTLPLQDDSSIKVGPIRKIMQALGVRDGEW